MATASVLGGLELAALVGLLVTGDEAWFVGLAAGIGALWALIIGSIVAGPGYVPAFIVMAVSYVAGAVLISLVRDTPPRLEPEPTAR